MPLKQTFIFEIRLYIAITIWLFSSCKVSDSNLIGQYKTGWYDRSTIRLDSSGTFKFWSDDLKLVLENENFFFTQGTWNRISSKIIVLNSISDSLPTQLFDIAKRELEMAEKSKFTFFDPSGDTVSIYQVYKNNKIVFARPHGPSLTKFEDKTVKHDTLYFVVLSGYSNVEIPINSSVPTEYLITLNREFRLNYFQNSEFLIRKNKLIRVLDKTKFKKVKPNGI